MPTYNNGWPLSINDSSGHRTFNRTQEAVIFGYRIMHERFERFLVSEPELVKLLSRYILDSPV